MLVFIYCLRDPRNKIPRYVGKSSEFRINKRLIEHVQPKRLTPHTHKNMWIKSLLSEGVRPELIILEKTDIRNGSTREQYWVTCFSKLGIRLTNSTRGGEGNPFSKPRIISEQQKINISNTLKQFFKNPKNKLQCSAAGLKCRGVLKTGSRFNTTLHVGVILSANNKGYRSNIRYDGRQIALGTFHSKQAAAEAYDVATINLFGPQSNLNFPDKLEEYKKVDFAKQLVERQRKTSVYKYVSFMKKGSLWTARNQLDKHIGCFSTESDAANAVSSATGYSLEQLKTLKRNWVQKSTG